MITMRHINFFLSIINNIMDKNSDLFFLIILILVVISFIILNILRTLENNIIKNEKLNKKL